MFDRNSICSGCELAVCPVNLREDVPGVDEEHLVFELGLRLAPVEEPERAWAASPYRRSSSRPRPLTSTAPDLSRSRRMSNSEPRASPAEFAMTNPARPVSFRAE
jgi:hypothetical protein